MRLRALIAGCAIAVGVAGFCPVWAQDFPTRPIRIIVPYPPGGGTDTAARPIAQKMSESMGQPVLVENRPGASEVIGTDAVARAAPDGYTVLLTTNAFAINAAQQIKLPYDPARDFTPVAPLITTPFMLVANPQLAASSVRELVALARARPGKLNYASLGAGTPHHLAMEWFKQIAGADIVAVPYKGVGPGLTAVIAGEVEMMLTGLTAGLTQVKSGKLRAIAVTTSSRAPAAPEVPTIAESGYPEYSALAWYGVLAPAATPPAVVARLNAELVKVLNAPDIRERFAKIGVDPAPGTPAALQELIQRETALWANVIKATGTQSK